jgi:hypothetical protein
VDPSLTKTQGGVVEGEDAGEGAGEEAEVAEG